MKITHYLLYQNEKNMKKITIAFCLLFPILTNAQLYITSGAEINLSSGENLFVAETFTNAGNLIIAPGATATLNGGSSSGTGTIKGSSTSNLIIGGTSTSGTYYFDQTTLGTTNVLKNLTISGTANATLGNALNITGGNSPGTVIVGSGTTLTTGGFLTLKSDSNGTACIGISTGIISGNLTVERYIPANGRRYRFLASPVVGSITSQWRDNGGNTSGRGIQITGPTGTVDASTNNAKSAFFYNETNTTGTINDVAKWSNIDGSTNLINGKGYRVFVRGDRSISLTTFNTTNNATTIWVNGSYPSSPVSLPVTYTTSGGQGWNLVGNPFPCNIDWMSASGWTKTNVGTGVAIYRPSTNSYAYSLLTSDASAGLTLTSLNGGGSVIGSGQGFFVKATGSSPVLTCTESVKTLTAPTTLLLKTTPSNQLRIKLTQDSANIDETLIVFGSKFNDEFLESEDFSKLANATVNVSSVVGVEKYAAINFISNNYTEKTIPLSVWGNTIGTYQLDITQVSGFDAGVSIYLNDIYLNTTTAIDQDKKLSVVIDPLSKVDNRFELVFKNSATNLEQALVLNTKLNVYPNPATDVLNINLNNANFKNSYVSITNVSGQQLMNTNMIGTDSKLNIEGLSNGVYFVTITNQNGFNQTVKFVK